MSWISVSRLRTSRSASEIFAITCSRLSPPANRKCAPVRSLEGHVCECVAPDPHARSRLQKPHREFSARVVPSRVCVALTPNELSNGVESPSESNASESEPTARHGFDASPGLGRSRSRQTSPAKARPRYALVSMPELCQPPKKLVKFGPRSYALIDASGNGKPIAPYPRSFLDPYRNPPNAPK